MGGQAVKDVQLVCHGDPCTMRLDDPSLQTLEEAHARGGPECRYYADRAGCAPPRFGCVQSSGLKVARYVLLLYSEVSEHNLEMEMDESRRLAPLPFQGVEGYIDTPERSGRLITDPEQVLAGVHASPGSSWT
jgi:hypothetical protein